MKKQCDYGAILDSNINLFHLIQEPIYIISGHTHNVLFANQAACTVFAWDTHVGKKCYEILQNKAEVCSSCNRFINMEIGETRSWIWYHPYMRRHFKVNDTIVRYQEQVCCLEVAIDISVQIRQKKRLRKALKKLKHVSYTDDMSKVCNRNALIRDIKQYMNHAHYGQSVGAAFFDLNELKRINDNYGHRAGDLKIITLADELKRVFHRNEIYRIGGDEFVVICRNISESGFRDRITLLQMNIQKNTGLSVAIGSAWSTQCNALGKMIMKADKRMYSHKRSYHKNNR
ncbi:hypothetical protein AB840_05235 [Megasphaera cerevisiae DSM 20462]|uniref:GGDEF domain-containing protein n=1 Tax=Megasphaera cerevisiae DSM 20462 TaxID=1122219 RepID=A0A0J6ZPU0_9FIRM|nr:GGDEF domain-containing protein [Megasphaera cerevisiae]KMO86931.1 hypothetical protein AB840_05235 [Megasphaera cerevisiae DSM 20462]OKY54116.1 hypothetical protein BSR42_03990 [Megasphaera cerevisiae]SJZ55491.1 diguanylate cyclase (GGDEF) domain-containing protein [Megasphaera cerevisiae DSM 20462]